MAVGAWVVLRQKGVAGWGSRLHQEERRPRKMDRRSRLNVLLSMLANTGKSTGLYLRTQVIVLFPGRLIGTQRSGYCRLCFCS